MKNETRPTPETDYEEQIDNGDTKPLFVFCRKLERERDELARWKREQIFVESQWDDQAVAKELGMPAGADIRKNILPAIQQLKRERDELRQRVGLLLQIRERDKDRVDSDSIAGSCDCNVKTNDPQHHAKGCKYRLICERDEAREELARMQTMAASVADTIAKRVAMLEAMQDAHGALENLIIAKRGGMQHANALIDATFAAKAAVKKLKPFLP